MSHEEPIGTYEEARQLDELLADRLPPQSQILRQLARHGQPVTCGHCGTLTREHRDDLPWCPHCRIWLFLSPVTGTWLSGATCLQQRVDQRRREQADQMEAIAAAALVELTTIMPSDWRAEAIGPTFGSAFVITLHPRPNPIEVKAELWPPATDEGWHVCIVNRTSGLTFPLFIPGGLKIADFDNARDAGRAAVAAISIEVLTAMQQPGRRD